MSHSTNTSQTLLVGSSELHPVEGLEKQPVLSVEELTLWAYGPDPLEGEDAF